MEYKDETRKRRIDNFYLFLKKCIKKILSIILLFCLAVLIIFSITFSREIIIKKSTMSEFKNNLFGLPGKELLELNRQMQNQYNRLKEWFDDLSLRITS